jgi:hypothetical protein
MNGLETALAIAVIVMSVLWIVMLGVVLLMLWRLRKVIFAVSLAFRGITELGRQMHALAVNVEAMRGRYRTR